MEELINKMKIMNDECSRTVNQIIKKGRNKNIANNFSNDPVNRYIYKSFVELVVVVSAMRDAFNEMATDIILLEEEINRDKKGEI
jgi:hypothetical protein